MTARLLRSPSGVSPTPGGTGDLERLLGTERRLEELVARARDEAAALVSRAREAAAAREAAVAAELEAALRDVATGIAAEQRRRATELDEATRREAQRFDAIGRDRVDALARHVVARIIGADL